MELHVIRRVAVFVGVNRKTDEPVNPVICKNLGMTAEKNFSLIFRF